MFTFLGTDSGPLVTIVYTVAEQNGQCKKLTLPFNNFLPLDVDTNESVPEDDLKENKIYMCLYPHHKTYYSAMVTKIVRSSRKRKRESG